MEASNLEKLIIVGGGLIGLSLAHELASKGKAIEVISRRRSEAAGFVAAGMLAPHAEGLQDELLELSQLSLELIPNWVKKIEANSGIKCGLLNCGIVVPFCNCEELDAFPTASFGNKLNRKDLEKEAPGIAEQWKYGLIFKQDGQIDNRRRLMRALEKACVELGVNFQEGVEVLNLIHSEQNFKGVSIRNEEGEVREVLGSQAIICCGAWSKKLLNDIPIFPVKGQMLSIQGPKNALKRVIFGHGTYMVPREDGLIVVGATSEIDAGFKNGLTPLGQKQLKEGVNDLIPNANFWPHMERWWGFRPCTPDHLPIIGEHSLKGLWIATGHYRNGVLLAAITADLLSKCICNEYLSRNEKRILNQFTIKRFNH